jgi:hypothetical protein
MSIRQSLLPAGEAAVHNCILVSQRQRRRHVRIATWGYKDEAFGSTNKQASKNIVRARSSDLTSSYGLLTICIACGVKIRYEVRP